MGNFVGRIFSMFILFIFLEKIILSEVNRFKSIFCWLFIRVAYYGLLVTDTWNGSILIREDALGTLNTGDK